MLSLAFVLAFIGAAVGLLIGILIFGEVSDAIQCPASGGGGGGGGTTFITESYDNLGTLGSVADAVYAEAEVIVDFLPPVTGKINEGVKQEGTSSFDLNGEIYLGSTASTWDFIHKLGTGNDEVSINLWINGDVDGSPMYAILTNFGNGSPDENGLSLYTSGSSTNFNIRADDGLNRIGSSFLGIPPDDSQWHMLTVTYNKSITSGNPNVKMYLDGVLLGTVNTASNFSGAGGSAKDKLTIGSDNDHNIASGVTENTFDVDDVAIWNGYTLTGTDITNLYNSGTGMAAGSISPSTLKGYWSFDDTTANQIEIAVDNTILFDTLDHLPTDTEDMGGSEQIAGQVFSATGEEISSLTINNIDNSGNDAGTLVARIYTGVSDTTSLNDATLIGTSTNTLALDGGNANNGDLDFTFTFNPPVTVTGSGNFIGLQLSSFNNPIYLPSSIADIGEDEGFAILHEFDDPSANWYLATDADILMKVNLVDEGGGDGPAEVGSEQCESAKETAWTVIGIIPVALFFALFAIFSAVGKPQ